MTDLTEAEIDLKMEILRKRLLNCTEGVKEVAFKLKDFSSGRSVSVKVRTVPSLSKVKKKIIQDCIGKWARKYEVDKFTFRINDSPPHFYSQD